MSAREDEDNINENGQENNNSCEPGIGENGDPTGESNVESAIQSQPRIADASQQRETSTEGRSSDSNDDVTRFTRRLLSIRRRQYRRRSLVEDSSGDEHATQNMRESSSEPEFPVHWEELVPSSSSSDSGRSTHSLRDPVSILIEDDAQMPKALQKPKPCHKWFAVREIINRESGFSPRYQGGEKFQHRYYGSLHAVQRLELMYKLENHRGCVNSIHFNRSGDLMVSGSDDKRIVLWNWAAGRTILSYDSGHTGNVFQAKFLPLSGDRHIVTCARDGQVRLSVLSGVGVCKGTRLLAQHKRTTHKLAIHGKTPHVFLSAGEDALVLSHDVRTSKANRLLFVKEGSNKVGLYSIHSNPAYSNEFIVTGEDQYIRLYDKRKAGEGVPIKKFCPKHLLKSDVFLHVTCAVFNYNGTEVIGSYNDDDIYLFDTRLPADADYVHKYEGHRNSMTAKGVNFFGPKSEFVVSGSDCGNIYFWDKSTEAIVQWMRGDEEGVVNCLEPHPRVPIIATSGLDSDVKIWIPSCEQEPVMKGLKSTVIHNQSDRDHSIGQRSDPFDNRQMRWLWRQIQRFEQRRNNGNHSREEDPVSTTTPQREGSGMDDSSSSEDEPNPTLPQCSTS